LVYIVRGGTLRESDEKKRRTSFQSWRKGCVSLQELLLKGGVRAERGGAIQGKECPSRQKNSEKLQG